MFNNNSEVKVGDRLYVPPSVNSAWAGVGVVRWAWEYCPFDVALTMETGALASHKGTFDIRQLERYTGQDIRKPMSRLEKGQRLLKLVDRYLDVNDQHSVAMRIVLTNLIKVKERNAE